MNDTSAGVDFDHLCDLVGIAPEFVDAFGASSKVSFAVRQAILHSLGLCLNATPDAELAKLQRLVQAPLPLWHVVEAGKETQLSLAGRSKAASCLLIEETGTAQALVAAQDETLALPALDAGYHQLRAEGAVCHLLAAPKQCFQSPILREARSWGLAAQLYSLVSRENFGIGDFGDLTRLVRTCAWIGSDFLALSPVHALFSQDRHNISPYSPSSRLRIDPLYLDLDKITGFSDLDLTDARGEQQRLQAAEFLDYPAIWALKSRLLQQLYPLRSAVDDEALQAFIAAQGQPLNRFALFEVLSAHFAAQGKHWLGAWPEPFQQADHPQVEAFAQAHQAEMNYHYWLQWQCEKQLEQAHRLAGASGMALGLYRDLAVGAHPSGAEVWGDPLSFCAKLAIGAPPDPLAPQGQNWGLPPLNPLHLQLSGFASFRQLLAANMRSSGALRIDHAFQLARLFVVPEGAPAGQGAYLHFPLHAMLAVLRIESHRARCIVIAENLGTGPDGFEAALAQSGIYAYKITQFERSSSGGFIAPQDYPLKALAANNTHDLPTLIGWWRGIDIEWRFRLGIFDWTKMMVAQAARRRELIEMMKALHTEKLVVDTEVPDEPPVEAMMAFLARTRSQLVAITLDDAAGDAEQPNLPGTVDGHPNWRRHLRLSLEALGKVDGPLSQISAIMQQSGARVR